MSRTVVAALLGAALVVASATGALAAAQSVPDQVAAAEQEAERLAPALTGLAAQAQDALASLEGTATALAEDVPAEGRPGCELDEDARAAAFQAAADAVGDAEARFVDGSAGAIDELEAGVDGFLAALRSSPDAAEVKAAFAQLRDVLDASAEAGLGTAADAIDDVQAALATADEALAVACAPEAQTDRLAADGEATVDLLSQIDGLLTAGHAATLAELAEAEEAILAALQGEGANEGDEGDEGDEQETTTTVAGDDEADDGDGDEGGEEAVGAGGGPLPFTGSAMMPLLVLGILVAGIGGVLVVANRRSRGRSST